MAFPMEKQLKDMWCWAAVSRSIDHFLSPGSAVTQCQVARGVLNRDCCGDPSPCNTPHRLQLALDAIHKFDRMLARPLTFPEIRAELEGKRLPVCARIGWNGGGGHFVVISGFRETRDGGCFVSISDPLFLNSTIPYQEFLTAYQNALKPLGGGVWTHSYFVKLDKKEVLHGDTKTGANS